MRQTIRTTLRKLEDAIRAAVALAVRHGELGKDTPVEGVMVQISSLVYLTGQLTRHVSGFARLANRIFQRHRTAQEWAWKGGKSSRPSPQRAAVCKSGRIQRAIWASGGSGLAGWQVFERSRPTGLARSQA